MFHYHASLEVKVSNDFLENKVSNVGLALARITNATYKLLHDKPNPATHVLFI